MSNGISSAGQRGTQGHRKVGPAKTKAGLQRPAKAPSAQDIGASAIVNLSVHVLPNKVSGRPLVLGAAASVQAKGIHAGAPAVGSTSMRLDDLASAISAELRDAMGKRTKRLENTRLRRIKVASVQARRLNRSATKQLLR